MSGGIEGTMMNSDCHTNDMSSINTNNNNEDSGNNMKRPLHITVCIKEEKSVCPLNENKKINTNNYGSITQTAWATVAPDMMEEEKKINDETYAGSVTNDKRKMIRNGFDYNNENKYSITGGANDNGEEGKVKNDVTYFNLMRTNREFRLYLASYIVTHIGEWFTYVACITLIEHLLGPNSTSFRTSISILVVLRLIPYVLLSALGGTLADSRDRRESMVLLDILGSLVVLLYLVAYHFQSISLVYILAFLQQAVGALYEPCSSSIVPLLVPDEEYLKKAITLSGLAWSTMAAIGAALGGIAVSVLGIKLCFVIDSLTYMASAFFMWQIGGTWNVADHSVEKLVYSSPWEQIKSMSVDGIRYLRSSFFGPLVLVKSSGALIFGASDVLNVSFSELNGNDERGNSIRLGLLFGFVGVGCFLGPLVADAFTNMKNPRSLQSACVWSFACLTLGWLGVSRFVPFSTLCLSTMFRAAGSSVTWIDSSLLLQKFSAPEMLGRVSAVDYALATLCEGMSALLAGILQDNAGLTAREVSSVMAVISAFIFLFWLLYHRSGGGASGVDENDGEALLESIDFGHSSSVVEALNSCRRDGDEKEWKAVALL